MRLRSALYYISLQLVIAPLNSIRNAFLQDSQFLKVVQQVVSHVHGGQQIIVRNIEADEKPGVFDSGDTITVATPENLTEQVAMTLASAISEVTMLKTTSTDRITTVELMEQDEQYVIASTDEMEVQTVVVV